MLESCPCGSPVRLGAMKISVNRKRGITHYIVHRENDKPPCVGEDWTCVALKPYPKREAEREWNKMIERWNAFAVAHSQEPR